MSGLPPLPQILASSGAYNSSLAEALSILFESSTILNEKLVPELSSSLNSSINNYVSLIDLTIIKVRSWDIQSRADFIAAHPRIGEVRNPSSLSQKEQTAQATAPEVISRLAYLNALYEKKYPGLRYITFVNGRSRTKIKDELECKLGTVQDLDPCQFEASPDIVQSSEVGGQEWLEELDRAIEDVAKIARSRLNALGIA